MTVVLTAGQNLCLQKICHQKSLLYGSPCPLQVRIFSQTVMKSSRLKEYLSSFSTFSAIRTGIKALGANGTLVALTLVMGITIFTTMENETEMKPRSAFTSEPVHEEGEHLIGAFIGNTSGPTLIVIGSLHGNEPGVGRKRVGQHHVRAIATRPDCRR